MATDRDDAIARRYRALATEEPPAALDAAILAQSRRAVGSRPGGLRRWGAPISIAAVLVLASGVVIRMQAEKPGIETAAPLREEATTPAPSRDAVVAPAAPAASEVHGASETPRAPMTRDKPARAPTLGKKTATETTLSPELKRAAPKAASGPPAAASFATPSPAPLAPAPSPSRQRAAPMQLNAAQPPASAAAAGAATDAAVLAPRARAAGQLEADALEKRAAPATPEAALERIAQLRAQGRDEEADKALEVFRRAYPGYHMSDADRERVRRRAP